MLQCVLGESIIETKWKKWKQILSVCFVTVKEGELKYSTFSCILSVSLGLAPDKNGSFENNRCHDNKRDVPRVTTLEMEDIDFGNNATDVRRHLSPPMPWNSLRWDPVHGFRYQQRPQEGSARLLQVQQLLQQAEERALSARNDPTPKITLEHVSVSFARSGGPGGQNVNKVNTKVDMRLNVKNAYWLSDRVRERILQIEKNRINKDGELVISSTKTRTQKGNIEDALEKLQAIIYTASYVPPPPSEEQKKKIAKLAVIGEKKRLHNKKALSHKKAFRRKPR